MKVKKGDKFTKVDYGTKSHLIITSDSIDGKNGKHFVFVSGIRGTTPLFFSVRKSTITKKNGWKRTDEPLPDMRADYRVVCRNTLRQVNVNLKPLHSKKKWMTPNSKNG